MGITAGAPINEAVSLLDKFDPSALARLRVKYPALSRELDPGRMGGSSDSTLDQDRAKVMIAALTAVTRQADLEVRALRMRMASARRQRRWSQILSLICTSGVLGTLALDKKGIAIAAAVLGLLASIGTLLAEHQEKLLTSGEGDIYSLFESAANFSYKAKLAEQDLRLLLEHAVDDDKLRSAVAAANALCDELHGLVIKMLGSRDAVPAHETDRAAQQAIGAPATDT